MIDKLKENIINSHALCHDPLLNISKIKKEIEKSIEEINSIKDEILNKEIKTILQEILDYINKNELKIIEKNINYIDDNIRKVWEKIENL